MSTLVSGSKVECPCGLYEPTKGIIPSAADIVGITQWSFGKHWRILANSVHYKWMDLEINMVGKEWMF
jgi:hypothetical protein